MWLGRPEGGRRNSDLLTHRNSMSLGHITLRHPTSPYVPKWWFPHGGGGSASVVTCFDGSTPRSTSFPPSMWPLWHPEADEELPHLSVTYHFFCLPNATILKILVFLCIWMHASWHLIIRHPQQRMPSIWNQVWISCCCGNAARSCKGFAMRSWPRGPVLSTANQATRAKRATEAKGMALRRKNLDGCWPACCLPDAELVGGSGGWFIVLQGQDKSLAKIGPIQGAAIVYLVGLEVEFPMRGLFWGLLLGWPYPTMSLGLCCGGLDSFLAFKIFLKKVPLD